MPKSNPPPSRLPKREHKIKQLLLDLGVSTEDSIVHYFPKVRDREDIAVLQCRKSGVIFLSRSDHIHIEDYHNGSFAYWAAQDRKTALLAGLEDDKRRCQQFKSMIKNKKWMDVGTGAGGILDLLSPVASKTIGIEPQDIARNSLSALGYEVYASIEDVPEHDFDVATLFHVLEHLTDPVRQLTSIRNKMAKGAKIVIEVPHAKDFLISFLENDAFKAFTFWSQHLILHTRESLHAFLQAAGFSNIVIQGFQRYPLANHLHWLSLGKPGGHIAWRQLKMGKLDQAYGKMLASIDRTDTLIAIAENQ